MAEYLSDERVAAMTARFERHVHDAMRDRRHLWIASVEYYIDDPAADSQHLGPETMSGPPEVGCYLCDSLYATARDMPCPGPPERPYPVE